MTDYTAYKTKLEAERADLEKELATLGVQNPRAASDWVATAAASTESDPIDVADGQEEYAERRATLASLETRLHEVNHALKKFASHTYGVCEISGQPIETERLDANPAARTCIAHKDDSIT